MMVGVGRMTYLAVTVVHISWSNVVPVGLMQIITTDGRLWVKSLVPEQGNRMLLDDVLRLKWLAARDKVWELLVLFGWWQDNSVEQKEMLRFINEVRGDFIIFFILFLSE